MLAVPNGLTNAPGGGEEMNSLEVDHTKGTQLILRPHAELA